MYILNQSSLHSKEFETDFANIMAYTCKNSCAGNTKTPLEEHLIVEFDDPCEMKIKS